MNDTDGVGIVISKKILGKKNRPKIENFIIRRS